MTYAPAKLREARSLLLEHLDINPLSVGIVGDEPHNRNGSSYHLGESALRPDGYSIVESVRDRDGLTDAASALDIGWFDVTVSAKRHTLRTFSVWLVAQCKAGTPDTADIREVIYSSDGETVKRWDWLGRRSTGDSSHLTHTHISYFRDSESRGKAGLFRRYLTEIGLLEDDMDQKTFTTYLLGALKDDAVAERLAWVVASVDGAIQAPAGSKNADGSPNTRWATGSYIKDIRARLVRLEAALATLAGRDPADEAAIIAGVLAGIDPQVIAEAIPAELAQRVVDLLAVRMAA